MASILVVLGSAPSAIAQGILRWTTEQPPPLHPTIIQGNYKDKTLPIVAVSGETPQVLVDGKLKSLSSSGKAGYTPARGAAYAPGSLSLKAMSANSLKTNLVLMFSDGGEVSGGTLSAHSDFEATVVPTQNYSDCYVAIIFFEQDYLDGKTDNPHATVHFESIKPLVGGRDNRIKLTFGFLDFGERRMGFFPLFFTSGMEIRSNQCELVARFFRHRETALHEAILKGFLQKNSTATSPPRPYLQVPPIIPDDLDFSNLPPTVKATFMVNEEGTVESIHFEENIPHELAAVLQRALHGWLFLPRMKEGRPMRTMVSLPVALRASATKEAEKPATGG